MLTAVKSLTMWRHGARACTFVDGGYAQPVLRLAENNVLLREEIIDPGTAVTLSEAWDIDIPSGGNDGERVAPPAYGHRLPRTMIET